MSIIYLDTSALLKLYIQEAYSDEVRKLVETAEGAGSSMLAYPEMAAALARAKRMHLLLDDAARSAWNQFLNDWPDFTRLKLSVPLTERAARLAWDFGLRGYDAMHLSAALIWQETLEERIVFATFDRLLWRAGKNASMLVWPEELTAPSP
jgi:predicted nucleic acid-binding protein